MASKWQQWMPLRIDAFRGSPAVQAMHPAARIGYLYLLAAQWQSEDCTLPENDMDLSDASGLGDELWEQHKGRILRNFIRMPDGRLRNQACYEEWSEAKQVFEANRVAKSSAGKRGASARWKNDTATPTDGKAMAPAMESDGKAIADAIKNDGKKCLTGTVTGTETKGVTPKPPLPPPCDSDDWPEGLATTQYAAAILERVGLPAQGRTVVTVAAAIESYAKLRSIAVRMAARQLALRAQEAIAQGTTPTVFWWQDGKYLETQISRGHPAQVGMNPHPPAEPSAEARLEEEALGAYLNARNRFLDYKNNPQRWLMLTRGCAPPSDPGDREQFMAHYLQNAKVGQVIGSAKDAMAMPAWAERMTPA